MAVEPSCLIGANGLDQGLRGMRRHGPREDRTMLRDDINNAVKDAMRAKDERKLSTLRMVNSTIKNADIAARGEGKATPDRRGSPRRVPENDQAAPGIRRAVRQGRPRRIGRSGARGDRDHFRLSAEADVGGRR